MLPKLARLDGGQFPFLDILEKQPPFRTSDGNIWYEASKNSDIDVEKNPHFALGIFWKASVHPWSGIKKDPMIDLGPYTEKIRLFLTGRGTASRTRIPSDFRRTTRKAVRWPCQAISRQRERVPQLFVFYSRH